MFSAFRTRFGIPGVIATVALVFAMTGGAFAAKYLITSTKQISPSVLKKLKGNAGPAGQQGPAGPAGAKGDTGAPGAPGKDGTSVKNSAEAKGLNCKEGGTKLVGTTTTYACNGEKGKQGEPWAVDSTLPSGATETGAWTFGPTAAAGEVNVPISFTIQLAASLGVNEVHFINQAGEEVVLNGSFELEEVTSTKCLGTAVAPSAAAGHLCVYTGNEVNFTAASNFSIIAAGSATPGADVAGARFGVEAGGANARGTGTWAVTAE